MPPREGVSALEDQLRAALNLGSTPSLAAAPPPHPPPAPPPAHCPPQPHASHRGVSALFHDPAIVSISSSAGRPPPASPAPSLPPGLRPPAQSAAASQQSRVEACAHALLHEEHALRSDSERTAAALAESEAKRLQLAAAIHTLPSLAAEQRAVVEPQLAEMIRAHEAREAALLAEQREQHARARELFATREQLLAAWQRCHADGAAEAPPHPQQQTHRQQQQQQQQQQQDPRAHTHHPPQHHARQYQQQHHQPPHQPHSQPTQQHQQEAQQRALAQQRLHALTSELRAQQTPPTAQQLHEVQLLQRVLQPQQPPAANQPRPPPRNAPSEGAATDRLGAIEAQLRQQRVLVRQLQQELRGRRSRPRAPFVARLSADLNAVVQQLQPAADDGTLRIGLIDRLQKLVHQISEAGTLQPFGSSVSGLHSKGADLDLTLVTDGAEMPKEVQQELVTRLAEVFEQSGQMENVQARPKARVPIVALQDKTTGLKCDICMCNMLAIQNSRLLRAYMTIDSRVRPLCFAIKYWAKRRAVNDPYRGSLSSYAWVLLAIHYLQTCEPPVLPCLQALRDVAHAETATMVDTHDGRQFDCYYYSDIDLVREAMARLHPLNQDGVGELLIGFFRRYTREFDFVKGVASIRTGRFLTKKDKNWTTKEAGVRGHLFCIEDPFEVTHDLGRVIGRDTLNDVRSELDRASQMLQDERLLEDICELYIPPDPPPKPSKKDKSDEGSKAKEGEKERSAQDEDDAGGASNPAA